MRMSTNSATLDLFVQSSHGNQVLCSICNCWLPANTDKFLSSHLNGRKHKQQVLKKQEKEDRFRSSIYVKGFNPLLPNLEVELEKYFKIMGKVIEVYVDKNSCTYAIIEFSKEEDVGTILSLEKPMFHGKKLYIKRRESSKQSDSKQFLPRLVEERNTNEQCLLPDSLKDQISKESDFLMQMKMLFQFFQLTDEDLKLRNLICQLLESALEEAYPGCKVLLFGSSLNGLGEKGCDVDLTLLTDGEISAEFYLETREIIQRFVPGCKKVNVVTSTKNCSVVKFFHTDSNISVDLSLNNHLALNNTKLLKSYLKCDEQVLYIIFTIRKWAKCFGFSGHAGHQVSQYSLTLMAIHFLQQVDPPVLPCKQECKECWREQRIDQWNVSFCECQKDSESKNEMHARDLLLGFFRFYRDFDFSKHIIGIHKKTCLLRTEACYFVNSLCLGDAEKDFKFNSPLVVQDPFKLTHNVTHNITVEGLSRLTSIFRQVCNVFQGGNDHLLSLFTESKKYVNQEKQKQKRCRNNVYSISLPNCKHSNSQAGALCFDYIKNLIQQDLRMRLVDPSSSDGSGYTGHSKNDSDNFEPEESTATAKRKIDRELDSPNPKRIKVSSSVESICYHVTAYADTWTKRRKQRRLILKLQHNESTSKEEQDLAEDQDSGINNSEVSSIVNLSTPTTEEKSCEDLSKSKQKDETIETIANSEDEQRNHHLLKFSLELTKALSDTGVCKVKLENLDSLGTTLKDYQTFYAYIKKELISVFK